MRDADPMTIARVVPLLFVITGAAGLAYQTVWMRMLIRAFGVTVHATTTTVAVFMAGLALGAALGARIAARHATTRMWGLLEVGAALAAAASSALILSLPELGVLLGAGPVLRVLLTALVLLPPTMLMGATLPVLVGVYERAGSTRSVSLLYGLNTLGAVVGTIAVGFVGIALLGEKGTVACAVALQVAVGLAALLAPSASALQEPERATPPETPPASPQASSGGPAAERFVDVRVLAVAASLIGFAGLASEIAWMRLAVFLVGSSVYGFSCVLSAYLFGIGVGSLASPRIPTRAAPLLLVALGACALLSARVFLWLGLAAHQREYLYSPLSVPSDVLTFLAVSAVVVFPFAFVSGALFPVVVRAATTSTAAAAAGRIYAVNTIGAVLGAVIAGFVLMPTVGGQGTLFVAALVLFVCAALVALFARQLRTPAAVGGLAMAGVALVVVFPATDVTYDIVARRLERTFGMRIAKHTETVDTTVTIAVDSQERPSLLLNGIFTSTKGRIGEAMAHLPLALQPEPKRALVICFGVGSTYAAASSHVPRVDAVELVSEVVNSFPIFNPEQASLLTREGNRVFVDDGRNFLLRSTERWDAIIIDGAPPVHSAGFVNLYSREMFALAREHLTERGVLLVFVPTLSYRGDVWGITRALLDELPHTAMWTSAMSGYMLLASRSALELTREAIDANLRGRAGVPPWFTTSLLFEQGRFLSAAELRELAASWEPVTDDRPRTEYPLARLLAGEVVVREAAELFTPPAP